MYRFFLFTWTTGAAVEPGYILASINISTAINAETTLLTAISGEITIDNGD